MPLYRDPKTGMRVTQYNMKWVEQAGLVKFDFLGLKTLTVLRTRRRPHPPRAASRSISPRCRSTIRRPTSRCAAARRSACSRWKARACARRSSRWRPTASRISSPSSPSTVRARWRTSRSIARASSARDPSRPSAGIRIEAASRSCEETFGIIVYQEQVMEVAKVLSGYSLGDADLLRRAMGKKIKKEMDAQRERFVEGAVARGLTSREGERDLRPPREVRRLRLQQEPRRGLRARRVPDRLPEGEPSGRVPRRVDDARSRQHRQARRIPPRGAASRHPRRAALDQPLGRRLRRRLRCGGEGRDPLRARGRSRASAGRRSKSLVEARGDAPFTDLADFARRLNPRVFNKRTLENLIAAGALDELEPDRARACAAVDAMMNLAQQLADAASGGTLDMFGGVAAADVQLRDSAASSPGPRRSGCSANTRRSASSSRAIRSTSTAIS